MRSTLIAFLFCCLAAMALTASKTKPEGVRIAKLVGTSFQVPPSGGRVNELRTESVDKSPHSNQPLIVGIFRDDGVIVPFAQYASRKWSNPWGIPKTNEPTTIADREYPWYQAHTQGTRVWQLALPSESGQSVTTSKSVKVGSHCQEVWALHSDYAKAKQPEPNAWGENMGIAFSQSADTVAMDRVSGGSADWARVTQFVGGRFPQAEAGGLTTTIEFYRRQLPPAAQRKKVTFSMVNLYRASLDNHRAIFFFEAGKEYPKPASANDSGCNNVSLLVGWVMQERGQLALINTDYWPTDCDRKDGGTSEPFAVVHLDGRVFAIVAEYSYEGDAYTILEIRRRHVVRVLETFAGSC